MHETPVTDTQAPITGSQCLAIVCVWLDHRGRQQCTEFSSNSKPSTTLDVGSKGTIRRVEQKDGWAMVIFDDVEKGQWVKPANFPNLGI